ADQAFIADDTVDRSDTESVTPVQSDTSSDRQKKRKRAASPSQQPLSASYPSRNPASRPRLLSAAPARRLFSPSLQPIEPWAWASKSEAPTLAPPPNRFASADAGSSTLSQRG